MKRIGKLLLVVLLWSCGGSGEDTPTPFSNGPIDELVQTYHIKDTVGLTDVVVSEKEDYHYLVGKKNGKFWLAQYDKDTKEELYSFVDNEDKFKFTETIDEGFGKTSEYKINLNPVSIIKIDKVIGMACEYLGADRRGYYYSYCIINNDAIVKFLIKDIRYSNIRTWYNNSILFYSTEEANNNSAIGFRMTNAYLFYKLDSSWNLFDNWGNEDYVLSPEFETALPINLFEYIHHDERGIISLKSISSVKFIWSKQVKTYDQAAKFNFILLNQGNKELKYKANVVLFDGSKDSFEFTIKTDTGEIID